jgi:hypothetical protein
MNLPVPDAGGALSDVNHHASIFCDMMLILPDALNALIAFIPVRIKQLLMAW